MELVDSIGLKARRRLFAAFSGYLARIEEHAGERLAIENGALADHLERLGELDQAKFNLLVVLRMGVARHQALGEKNLHGFAQETGAGIVLDQRLPFLCPVAGLL